MREMKTLSGVLWLENNQLKTGRLLYSFLFVSWFNGTLSHLKEETANEEWAWPECKGWDKSLHFFLILNKNSVAANDAVISTQWDIIFAQSVTISFESGELWWQSKNIIKRCHRKCLMSVQVNLWWCSPEYRQRLLPWKKKPCDLIFSLQWRNTWW